MNLWQMTRLRDTKSYLSDKKSFFDIKISKKKKV